MADITYDDVTAYIMRDATATELEHIRSLAQSTAKSKATQAAYALAPGTKVRTRDLRPKYLSGLKGEIIGIAEKGNLKIKVDDDHKWALGKYPQVLNVPPQCVEAL
jgi:preprotein translocase subunit YajC